MILFFGKRRMRIKRYVDNHIVCEKCGRCEQKFSVYQEYFHIFAIPLFPFKNSKTIASVCTHCGDKFNERKKDYYVSKTKTPWFLYSGWIVLAGFILTIIFAIKLSSQQTAEYVANPHIGDVFVIHTDSDDNAAYSFLKIKNIYADTLEVMPNYFNYNRFTSTMDTADFFISNYTYKISKSGIKKMLEKGIIRSVERNYDSKNQFMIEKECSESELE